MELGKIAVALRPRSQWEAIDLGFTLMRRWWRPVYAALAPVYLPIVAAALLVGSFTEHWIGLLIIWWLKPLYDRVVLHLLSRAVFGEIPSARDTLARAREWLGTGLPGALILRYDLARSFNLPVRQLEGQTGREGRARRALLGRRVRSYAVWLTIVCMHFEGVFTMSSDALFDFLLPASGDRPWLLDMFSDGSPGAIFSVEDVILYACALALVEPFYVAAGFALYLNRRTVLEGWDIELALRRLAERATGPSPSRSYASAAVLALAALLVLPAPDSAFAQQGKNPREEIREVLKATEFPHDRERLQWVRRNPPPEEKPADTTWARALGYALARAAEVLLWIGAAALVVLAARWLYRNLPREDGRVAEPYRPPSVLFGLELAPETLPPDVSGSALALAREGRIRDALGLLYRGALSELAHRRSVELLASSTEQEVLDRARARLDPQAGSYFALLVAAWQAAAYARRVPALTDVERLARDYEARLASSA